MSESKTVYLLNIGDYAPEITSLTYPLIESYADKIGARVHVISERRFPDWPVVYEKLQIRDLAREAEDDWAIYVDSDALIHPDTLDFTDHLERSEVFNLGSDFAPTRFRQDAYFRRDGRNIGVNNCLTAASSWCLDLWAPLDISFKQALENIRPTAIEARYGITADHLIDDYALSRNVARYGLGYRSVEQIASDLGFAPDHYKGYFFHLYLGAEEEKLEQMHEVLTHWGLA